MQRNDAWPTGRESIPHLAQLITDFQRPSVHMMLQRLQVPRQFLRATPHRVCLSVITSSLNMRWANIALLAKSPLAHLC